MGPVSAYQDVSDAAVVVAIARFHQDALAEAYRRHAGSVFALARRVLGGDAAGAEEVVQEVFLKLWDAPERFDPERGSLRSFLLAHTHSRAVDKLRSEGSRRRREENDARRTAESGYDLELEIVDVTVAEELRKSLAVLPEKERKPIELAYFGGHTYRDVALILDEAEGTVKSRIRSGLRRLREELVSSGVVS